MKGVFLINILCGCFFCAAAQGRHDDGAVLPDSATFCKQMRYVIGDDTVGFVHMKGGLTDTNASAFIYSVTRSIAGAITSSIIISGDEARYEAVMYQGASKEKMADCFAYFKKMMDGCLQEYDVKMADVDKQLAGYAAVWYENSHAAGKHCVLSIAEHNDIDSLYNVLISVNK